MFCYVHLVAQNSHGVSEWKNTWGTKATAKAAVYSCLLFYVQTLTHKLNSCKDRFEAFSTSIAKLLGSKILSITAWCAKLERHMNNKAISLNLICTQPCVNLHSLVDLALRYVHLIWTDESHKSHQEHVKAIFHHKKLYSKEKCKNVFLLILK